MDKYSSSSGTRRRPNSGKDDGQVLSCTGMKSGHVVPRKGGKESTAPNCSRRPTSPGRKRKGGKEQRERSAKRRAESCFLKKMEGRRSGKVWLQSGPPIIPGRTRAGASKDARRAAVRLPALSAAPAPSGVAESDLQCRSLRRRGSCRPALETRRRIARSAEMFQSPPAPKKAGRRRCRPRRGRRRRGVAQREKPCARPTARRRARWSTRSPTSSLYSYRTYDHVANTILTARRRAPSPTRVADAVLRRNLSSRSPLLHFKLNFWI